MAVYTNKLRHLNARWIIDVTTQNKLYCGVSKNAIQLFNDEQIQLALNSCNVFTRVYSSFVKENNTGIDFDAKFLTKQLYDKQNYIVSNHTFLDNICYWDFISDNDAQNQCVYNTDTYFILSSQSETISSELEGIRSFYFFYNLKLNGEQPNTDQILRQQGDTITADYIVVKERIGCVQSADTGCCDIITNSISLPRGVKERFNYFVSF